MTARPGGRMEIHTTGAPVGRGSELATVRAFVSGPSDAGPAGLVVSGPAGIGKTTLFDAGLQAARDDGLRTLVARPSEVETAMPYAVLADLVTDVRDDAWRSLPAAQARALRIALLQEEPGDDAVAAGAVARALVGILGSLAADEPLLIAIDDVQWTDPPSARALTFAARRLPSAVRLLLAQRAAPDDGPPLDLERARLTRLSRLEVGPLAVTELHELLRSRLGLRLRRPALLELHASSGGNPLLALEQVSAGIDDAEDRSLAELLGARIGQLDAAARSATLAAASVSRPTAAVVRDASGAAGLEAAIRAGVLRPGDAGRLRFGHPLMASIAYQQADPAERRATHERLAALVPDEEERALHLARAWDEPDADRAATVAAAADRARRRGAPEVAARLADQAVRLTPVHDGQLRRARIVIAANLHLASGDPAAGRDRLTTLVAQLPPGPERADVLQQLSSMVESIDECIRLCEQALAEAGTDAVIRAWTHLQLATYRWLSGDLRASERETRLAVAAADDAGEPELSLMAIGEMVHAQVVLGLPVDDGRLVEAVASGGEFPGIPPSVRPAVELGIVRLYTDRLDEARALLEPEFARLGPDDAGRLVVGFRLVEVGLRAGDWRPAFTLASELRTFAELVGLDQEQAVILMMWASVATHLGRADEARTAALTALDLCEQVSDRLVRLRLQGILGFLELSLGRPERAREWLEPALAALIAQDVGEPSPYLVVENALEVRVTLGDLAGAAELIAWLEHAGRRTGRAWHAAIAARGRALLHAANRRLDDALLATEESLEAHASLPQPFEHGRTLLVTGVVLRRARRWGPARERLTAALERFDALGAALWAERAAAELARLGGRSGVGRGLTPTERRVAELAASGLSNGEIGARLSVATRTVEAHLTRVYEKLELASRIDLVRALDRE